MTAPNTLITDLFRVSYQVWPGNEGKLEKNTRPPLVLVHSGGASPAQWRPLMAILAERQRQRPVFAPALLGYSGSVRRNDSAPDAEDDGALLSSFLQAIAPDEGVDLVGHSYGAVTAIAAAQANPQVIRSLCLIEPVCFDVLAQTGAEGEWQTILEFAQTQIWLAAEGDLHHAAQAFVCFWNGPLAWKRLTTSQRNALACRMPKVATEWRYILAAQTDLPALRSLAPVQLIAGGDTHPLARAVFEVLCADISHAVSNIIPGAGHMIPLTHARLLASLLLSECIPRFGTFRSRGIKLATDTPL